MEMTDPVDTYQQSQTNMCLYDVCMQFEGVLSGDLSQTEAQLLDAGNIHHCQEQQNDYNVYHLFYIMFRCCT